MIVLIALMLIVLLMTVTFSVDVAYMQLTRTELRAVTDASAKAAAEALSREQSVNAAIDAARTIAAQNSVAGDPLILGDDDIVVGRSSIIGAGQWEFTPGGSPPNAVKIFGRRTTRSPSGPVPLFFGGIFGFADFEPDEEAVASQLDRDVALVIDHSGSMNGNGRWAGLIVAVTVFMTEVERTPQVELVSLTGYSSEAKLLQPLTDVASLIRRALDRLRPNGRTNIGDGLLVGSDSLIDGRGRQFAAKTIVLMTDGNHNTGTDPIDAARTVKQRGHVVHTITFGKGANAGLMREVANITGGRYYHADNNVELVEVFREIALTLPVVLSQ